MGSYFGWGRYEQTPAPRLTSFSMDTFTACVGDGTIFTGVAGATTYQINMGNARQFDFGMVRNLLTADFFAALTDKHRDIPILTLDPIKSAFLQQMTLRRHMMPRPPPQTL
ncbi:MAG TPA: hypothetical protein VGO47_10280 [Chlamydiales bacterium]|nr:hypothetical protein [Chlamydiales bacterium]